MQLKLLPSTLQLLRLKFSLFLMPIYWFALSEIKEINFWKGVLIFIILHLLIYPSSNGYNSYEDNDTTSIGGVEKPLAPTKQLLYATIVLDFVGIILALFVSIKFTVGLLIYIAASRAYSSRKIRLKKYPVIGYLTTTICQGALIFWMVYEGASLLPISEVPIAPMIISSCMIGSLYPLTQIYQHEADANDGVKTISMLLGKMGTFIFSAILYASAMALLANYYLSANDLNSLILFTFCTLPILIYFFWWMTKVYANNINANFNNTMRLNLIATICSNIGFILILITKKF
jgi:1,4-dihydroxy-2-naphthoate polyprenyltransferase